MNYSSKRTGRKMGKQELPKPMMEDERTFKTIVLVADKDDKKGKKTRYIV